MLKNIDPMDFCCPRCLFSSKPVGVAFDCGHTNCCELINKTRILSNNRADKCLVLGCPGKKVVQPPWHTPRERELIPWAHQEYSNYGSVVNCPKHGHKTDAVTLHDPYDWDLHERDFCLACLRKRGGFPKGYFLLNYAKSVNHFREAYLQFDDRLRESGRDVLFRDVLDQVAAQILVDFTEKNPQKAIRDSDFSLIVRIESGLTLLFDAQLVQLGNLLQHFSGRIGTHAEAASLAKVAEFLVDAAGAEINHVETGLTGKMDVPSDTTLEMRELFQQHWPYQVAPSPKIATFWDVILPAIGRAAKRYLPMNQKMPRQTKKAILFICFSKTHRRWRNAAVSCLVLRPSDASYLASEFPPITAVTPLVQISEERGSGRRFQAAVRDQPNTCVVLHSEGHRLLYFLENPWVGPQVSYRGSSRLINLNKKLGKSMDLGKSIYRPETPGSSGPFLVSSTYKVSKSDQHLRLRLLTSPKVGFDPETGESAKQVEFCWRKHWIAEIGTFLEV